MTISSPDGNYAQPATWSPAAPRFRPLRLALSLLVGAASLSVAGLLLSGVHVKSLRGALIDAALIGVLNALLPPIVAAVRLPFTLIVGFFAVLAVDAGILLLVSAIAPDRLQGRLVRLGVGRGARDVGGHHGP